MGNISDKLFRLKFHILTLFLLWYITYRVYFFYTGNEFKYMFFKRKL